MKKHFHYINIGEYFGCWGDQFLNYNSPVWIICRKDSDDTAVELHQDGTDGQRFPVKPFEEFIVYSKEEIPTLLEEIEQ